MTDTHDLRVSARTAQLLASDGDDDGPPWRFSGVAVAAGDILHMDDGTPVLFTEEELRSAAETQTGEPLTKDHPEDDQGRPVYPPPTEETVGKVPRAGWLEDVGGVGYEATTHDETIATGVQAGSYDVSVHPTFTLGEKDPETDAHVAENVQFRDLSVVSKGDSPSNTAEWGANQALASLTASAIGDELTASADGAGDSDRESLVSSAVNGTLRALGIVPDDVDAEGLPGDESPGNEGAESPTDSDTSTMEDDTRDEYREFITAHSSFDEDDVDGMGDAVLENTHEIVAENATDDGGAGDSTESTDGDTDDGPEDDDTTLADMTVGELGSALQDQGFVTEDNIGDLTDQVTAQASKAEKVDEIIAATDDYDEDDREDLMASADKVVDREHERVTGTPSAQIPGAAGLTASAGPDAGDTDGDEDLDAYGTGVAEH